MFLAVLLGKEGRSKWRKTKEKEIPAKTDVCLSHLSCINSFITKSKTQRKRWILYQQKFQSTLLLFICLLCVQPRGRQRSVLVSTPGSVWRTLICTVNIFTDQSGVTCCFKWHEIISSHHYTTRIINTDDAAPPTGIATAVWHALTEWNNPFNYSQFVLKINSVCFVSFAYDFRANSFIQTLISFVFWRAKISNCRNTVFWHCTAKGMTALQLL